MKSAKNVRRILVSVPTASYPERRKLEGILTYATEKRGTPWHVHIESSGGYVRQRLLDLPKWECDGIIAYVDTDRSLSEIAENCGFASASHLCADIKAAFGMTPVQLRQHPV